MKETVKIEGMMCGHCEKAVKAALEALEGVEKAEVSHEKGTAILTLSKEIPDADIRKAVEDKDYTFDWHFTPMHSSSQSFSTLTGSVLHSFLPELQPGHA